MAGALASAPARAATYYLISKAPGSEGFLDHDNLGGDPGVRTAWETLVFAKPQTVENMGGYSILSFHLSIDCAARRIMHTSFAAYDDHGESMGSAQIKTPWQDIAPNSVSDVERGLLCDGKAWPGQPALVGSLEDLRDFFLGVKETPIVIGRRPPAPPAPVKPPPPAAGAGDAAGFRLPPPPASAP